MLSKKNNKKGFTLMEMLIVVAIIAVLVAIAIPTFTTSLNKARVATDKANIRSGYASVMADVLTNKYEVDAADAKDTYTYHLNKDGSVSETATDEYKTIGKNDDENTEIAGVDVGTWEKDKGVTYTYYVKDATTDAGTTAAGTIKITMG